MELTVEKRRTWIIALLAVAIIAFLAAVAVLFTAPDNPGPWLVGALVLLVLALAGELFLLVYSESKKFDEQPADWYEWEKETRGTEELLLRCSNCRETFTVLDDGTRPLHHTCPHCGRAGVLRDAPPPSGEPASS
ncbi:MAG: FmdB family zinc ribbon protein [Thermoplasmatota archaeon]